MAAGSGLGGSAQPVGGAVLAGARLELVPIQVNVLPCTAGRHRFAYLAAGGIECVMCGMRRR